MKIKNILVSVIIFMLLVVGILWALNMTITPHAGTDHDTSAKKVNSKPIRVVALGDSLTEGVGDTTSMDGYPTRLKNKIKDYTHNSVVMSNFGISGERSDQILNRLEHNYKLRQRVRSAKLLVLTAGGNNLLQTLQKNVTDNSSELALKVNQANVTYSNNIKNIFSGARKLNPDIKIFMISIYNPFFVYFPNVATINSSVEAFNTSAQNVINSGENAYFVNVNKPLSEGQFDTSDKLNELKQKSKIDTLNPSSLDKAQSTLNNNTEKNIYLSDNDHFHPNGKGYDVMTKYLFESIKTNANLKK